MIIGILSPDGIFMDCCKYGHMDLASEICESIGIDAYGICAEDCLLKRNYIFFREADCYKSYWDKSDDIIKRMTMTEEQFGFILRNKYGWNNLEQEKELLDMLYYDGGSNLLKRYKEFKPIIYFATFYYCNGEETLCDEGFGIVVDVVDGEIVLDDKELIRSNEFYMTYVWDFCDGNLCNESIY